MKKMNRKGFSLVELLGTIVILGILSVTGLIAYTRYKDKARIQAYDTLAQSAINATEEYIMDHPGTTSVSFEELMEEDYLEKNIDPGTKQGTCEGKVVLKETIEGSGNSLEVNEYDIHLCCSNYNYTYTENGKQKSKDKYCKAYPFSLEELKEKINNIKVLNVYPYHSSTKIYGDQLKNWMDEYGKGIIEVTPVYIQDFNSNPESYLGTNGNWKYDEVVFGFVDCNGSQDLSPSAAALMDEYLSGGGAAIFGHDTLTTGCGNHRRFNTLAKYVNMDLNPIHNPYPRGNKIKIIREGVFTQYPYEIGNLDTELTIPTSHVYGQSANGDIWLTFNSAAFESGLPADMVYLSTYGNNAFIQTGHSNGNATADEQKIIANIIFYMVAKQYIIEE